MSESDTPRTDALVGGRDEIDRCLPTVALLARQLKRELTAARAEIERLNFALKQASSIYDAVTEQRDKEREIYGKSYSAELERSNHYKQQRDRLAEACKKLMAIIGEPNSLIDDCWVSEDEMDEAWNIADEALQSLTTNEL